jgi:hypothetical protein
LDALIGSITVTKSGNEKEMSGKNSRRRAERVKEKKKRRVAAAICDYPNS